MSEQNEQNRTSKKAPRWVKAFLSVLRDTGNVRAACQDVGIARSTVYEYRAADPGFAAAWDEALQDAADLLEQEARRRAYEGVEKPVFGSLGQGQGSGEIGRVREYSDTLMIFLLKGARPEVYRERANVLNVTVTAAELEKMDSNQLDTLIAQLSKS